MKLLVIYTFVYIFVNVKSGVIKNSVTRLSVLSLTSEYEGLRKHISFTENEILFGNDILTTIKASGQDTQSLTLSPEDTDNSTYSCKQQTIIFSNFINERKCGECNDKTIREKDIEIKKQASEITNLKKELAVQNSTMQQLSKCIESKDTIISEKDVEIEKKLIEMSKLEIELAEEMSMHKIQICLKQGRSKNKSKALYDAAENNRLKEVHILLMECVDPNGTWTYYNSALWRASVNGSTEIAKQLIAFGADVHFEDRDGWTPLMRAAENGHVDIVRLLLARQAKVNHLNKRKNSATHYAAWHEHVQVLNTLVAVGGYVNARNVDGLTPMSKAAIDDNADKKEKIVAILKAAGATQ